MSFLSPRLSRIYLRRCYIAGAACCRAFFIKTHYNGSKINLNFQHWFNRDPPRVALPALKPSILKSVAVVLACLLLVVIPFRATVGARSALLLLATLFFLGDQIRHAGFAALWPPSRSLRNSRMLIVVAALWLVLVFAWSLASDDPRNSLTTMRRDVLSPIIAFCLFFALTKNRRDLMRWAMCIGAAQLVLTILVVRDPFPIQISDAAAYRPAYIDVGVLSAWLVVVASLVPALWATPEDGQRRTSVVAVIFTMLIVVAAIYSRNRFIWPCFAGMISMGMLIHMRNLRAQTGKNPGWRKWFTYVVIVAILAMLTWSAVQFRAGPLTGELPINHLLHDPRGPLWDLATDMIGEQPLYGHGYDAATLPHEFSTRYSTAVGQPINPMFDHPHNTLLRYGLQMGVVGMALILALFGALTITFLRLSKNLAITRMAAICGIALVTGFFLRNMTDDFFSRQSLTLFAAIAGMLHGVGTPRQH